MINSALRYRVQAPFIDSLLSDIGINGSDLAKSSVLRDAQDLARTGNEMARLKGISAAKPGDSKAGDSKPGDSKPADGKSGGAKSGEKE